jgi:large subunit ribosomal protein L4
MPTVTLKKSDGSGSGHAELSDKLFAAKINKGLMHQAVQAEMTNSRQGTQSTKTRGTVKHTTRKPYKQKGTGRARQGMFSAPHYRHGGIALGPHPRDLHHDLPKKMKRAAIAGALSAKTQDGAVIALAGLAFDKISTKTAAALLTKLELAGKRVLVIVAEHDPVVYKSFRNIPGIEVRIAPAFSTRDVLAAQTILLTKDAISKIESVWGKGKDGATEDEAVAKPKRRAKATPAEESSAEEAKK